MSTPLACGASSASSVSMFTTTCCTLGFATSATLRRVTTTTFLHSGLCTSRCRMCPPTLPVAPSNIAVYSTLGISVRSRVASGADIPVLDERIGPDVRDQLFLGDHVARAVDQELENRECARTDLNRP